MTSVIVDGDGSVIEQDEVVYAQVSELEHEHKHDHGHEHTHKHDKETCSRTIKISLHFH